MKWHAGAEIFPRLRTILLVACLFAAGPIPSQSQSVGWSLKIGGGYTGWTGTYEAAGRWAGSLVVLTAEMKAGRRVGVLAEIGGAISQGRADDNTVLEHSRTQLGLIARWYPLGRDGTWIPYADAGGDVWLGATCNVIRENPLYGKRLECRYWEPDPDDGGGPFRPSGSGITPFVELGLRRRTFGIGVRYDIAGPAMLENNVGDISARTLHFTFEWMFKRLK